MDTIRLGSTTIEVPRPGFGGIPIQTPPEEQAVEIVRESLDLGIRFIDTSRMYTCSEERIGKAIEGRRDEVVLATKSTARTAEGIAADLETSLSSLGTGYIDLYQFHNVSTDDDLQAVVAPDGPLDVIRRARDNGTVRHIGITSHRLSVALEAVRSGRFETIMIALNFVNTEAARDLLPLARERGVGVIVMKPMAGGMLENPALSFKYLQQFPDVLPLIGISLPGEMPEIIDIIEANEPLTGDEREEMERIRTRLGSGFCRMCNYCQPCPQGIMISAIMYTPVALKKFDPERIFTGQWNTYMEKVADCIDCGECETRCPYDLPIRERIRAEAEQYFAARDAYLAEKTE